MKRLSREIRVRVLDEDLISDFVTMLEDLERDLNKAMDRVDEIKEMLKGKVEVEEA